jgi:hypothetical protein
MRGGPAIVRAREALPAGEHEARRSLAREALTVLRVLADAVARILPELDALERFASRPNASSLSVGWFTRGARLADAARLSLTFTVGGLDIAFGYGRPGILRGDRDRRLAEGMRRRRALGETLLLRLAALRAEGLRLFAHSGASAPLAEEEWLRTPAGTASFFLPEATLGLGEGLVRAVAWRVAALAGLGASLGSFVFEPLVLCRGDPEAGEAARSLRWDERALGEGSPPAGIVPVGRTVFYDPISGWFVPETMASMVPASAARARLLRDLGVSTVPALSGTAVPVGAGLHTRLARWLVARGVSLGTRDVMHLEIRVADRSVPKPGERPVLEVLVATVLEDPSGDTAAALAGLLVGAPWRHADPLDPVAVAACVPPRFAASAARGIVRLRELGVLRRGVRGGCEDVEVCLTHPALRPVVALAVEQAHGHREAFPEGAWEATGASGARSWELLGVSTRGATLESVARRFVQYARAAGLVFDLDLVRSFVVGLCVKPFAVLSGVSGTGKTALALTFARFMTDALEGGSDAHVAVVPVRPDWLDSRGLLGYLNVLRGEGVYEDTAALRVMLHALDHPDAPHFLLLDEMNLARVEHYLAEVLSAMESGAPIPLHGRAASVPSSEAARRVPAAISLPPNLFVLGTVNLDESTHALSAKVFDRAWVWDFPPAPPTSLLQEWLAERRVVPPATADERRSLLEASRSEDPARAVALAMGRDGAGRRLDRLFDAMALGPRPFGFRAAAEVLRFIHLCEREAIDMPPVARLDRAVLGKILPRLTGSRRELEPVLRALLAECEGSASVPYQIPSRPPREGVSEPPDAAGPIAPPLPSCARRVRDLLARLERDGHASFSV